MTTLMQRLRVGRRMPWERPIPRREIPWLRNPARLRWLTHLAALFPLAWLLWDAYTGRLSVNPIQDITFRTGRPALVLLVLSLACTPTYILTGWRSVIGIRRLLGLYAFFYATLHFLVFVGLDYGFDWPLIQEAIFEKRFALAGFAAWLVLLPLAITSTQNWMRRLGRRWKSLHRAAYLAGVLAVVHFLWLVKGDYRRPVAWGVLLAFLLLVRLPPIRRAIVRLRARGLGLRRA